MVRGESGDGVAGVRCDGDTEGAQVAALIFVVSVSLSQTSWWLLFCCLSLSLAPSSASILYISTLLRAKFFPRPSF